MTSEIRPQVTYEGIDLTVETPPGTNLLELSVKNKIPHLHECGGNGLCTTCRVKVIEGRDNLSEPTAVEMDLAQNRKWDPQVRLACQARVQGNVTVKRLVWTGAEISKLQLENVSQEKGEERSVAILFCDLRNFTVIANQHPNFDLAYMLNEFFSTVGDPIVMNNGIIYQYAGDEIIGIFGISGEDPEKICMDAMRAALGMQYAVARLNKLQLVDFETEFQVGIGLHYGEVFLGHIGHPSCRQFCVIGDPVNVTSRIQSQNKDLDTNILISEHFLEHLPANSLHLGIKSMVSLKGKDQLFAIHEVLGFITPDAQLEVQSTLDVLLEDEAAFAATFYEKVFQRAPQVRELFKSNLEDQGRVLTHMLSGVVHALSRPEHLVMGLQALGEHHKLYGVEDSHYPLVQEVLLETIYEQLGEEATESVKASWAGAIGQVINLMRGPVQPA